MPVVARKKITTKTILPKPKTQATPAKKQTLAKARVDTKVPPAAAKKAKAVTQPAETTARKTTANPKRQVKAAQAPTRPKPETKTKLVALKTSIIEKTNATATRQNAISASVNAGNEKVTKAVVKSPRKVTHGKPPKNVEQTEKTMPPKTLMAARTRDKNKTENSVMAQSAGSQPQPSPIKAKRVRVPKDFAQQYSGEEKQKRVVETLETKRARRDAALRQKMRDAMDVGDELIARLRRAGMIGGAEEAQNGHGAQNNGLPRTMRRSRKWESRCGKCGSKSLFKTQAGLCAKCGAIMVRE